MVRARESGGGESGGGDGDGDGDAEEAAEEEEEEEAVGGGGGVEGTDSEAIAMLGASASLVTQGGFTFLKNVERLRPFLAFLRW